MKEIKAILQPSAITRVLHALHELPHFPGATLSDALGQGRGRGKGGTFVLDAESLFFHPKKLLSIIASDHAVDSIVAVIRDHARTGNHGDGLIVVTEVSQSIRIRSGESQSEAL